MYRQTRESCHSIDVNVIFCQLLTERSLGERVFSHTLALYLRWMDCSREPTLRIKPIHTSNNVEATFDIVAFDNVASTVAGVDRALRWSFLSTCFTLSLESTLCVSLSTPYQFLYPRLTLFLHLSLLSLLTHHCIHISYPSRTLGTLEDCSKLILV